MAQPHFGGGMAVQGGLVSINLPSDNATGFMTGVGGRLHFYTGNYVRIGGGGATVNLAYSQDSLKGSYYSMGYGGLTCEGSLPYRKWRFSAGALVGGGAFTNLDIRSKSGDTISATFLHHSTFIAGPILTLERSITHSISLMIMGDYLLGSMLGSGHSLGGPKFHIGVLFNK